MISAEKKSKTETISFRLDSYLIQKLRHEAEHKDISLNTFVSHIFKEHIDWHSNAAKAGFITIQKGLMLDILKLIPETQIEEIAEHVAKRGTRDFVLMLRNEYNITSALDVIETWIRIAGYPYKHDISDLKHHYAIHHDMGKKWSIYLKEQYESLFEDFGVKRVDFTMTPTTLSFAVNTEDLS